MSDSQPTSELNFHGNVDAPNSHFGCTIIYQDKNLEDLLNDAVEEIRQTITTIYSQNDEIRQSLLTILNSVESRLKIDIDAFESLITQISCQKKINQEIAYQYIVHTINFFVSAIHHDSGASLPQRPYLTSKISNRNCWLFSAGTSINLGFEHHKGAIADYLASNPDKHISDGNCYIFKLLENCGTCNNGVISHGGNGILDNFLIQFISGRRNNADFFSIEIKRNLTFKCGDCLCNITRIDESGDIV